MIRHMAGCTAWRILTSSNTCVRLASSTSPISPQEVNPSTFKESEKTESEPDSSHSFSESGSPKTKKGNIKSYKNRGSLVAAALSSVAATTKNPVVSVEELLQSAKTVEDILSTTRIRTFTSYHALQVLSLLAEWTTNKKITMNDFESDPRFIKLCKMIGPKQQKNDNNNSNLGDLGVVLSVTGEDQAVDMVSGISFSQKIRVLSSLALKKRRSLHLLRVLAKNISSHTEKLDIKQAADVLYAMSVLNFPDGGLLSKAVSDICTCLFDNNRPAVVGSILTSIGILKYRNAVLLDSLAQWVEANASLCREQDLISLLLTLASVNYQPENAAKLYEIILPTLSATNLRPIVWLDVVWALSVLNMAESHHLQSVLATEFVESLTPTGYLTNIPAPARLKLLNTNAVAELIVKNYKGPLLADALNLKFPLQRSREKELLVGSVVDSLKNLLPTSTYLQTDVDTGYGFLIDAECAVDAKCNPLPVEDASSKSTAERKRIAVLVCDYHDMCRESEELCGTVALQVQILEHLGFTVMTVTHLEFKPREKLVSRVKLLEQKLKKLAAAS